jgi:hypothetical protein
VLLLDLMREGRLRQAGISSAKIDALRTAWTLDLQRYVDSHSDAAVYSRLMNGATLPTVDPDPYPQYALRTSVAALAGGVPKDTITIDARDHGATGDGVTDDTAAILAALDACPEGGEVLLRPGTYLVSSPILVRRNRGIRGLHAGLWPYDTGGPVRIKASAGFVGDAVVRFRDEEELYGSVGAAANGLYVGPNDQSGISLTRLTIDGFSVAGGIDGIKASGLVRSVRLTEVTVRRCSGSSFRTVAYTRVDGLNYYPRGWRLTGCVSDTAGSNGFALNLCNDTTLTDCLAVNSTSHGFYLAGAGELLLIGCRSAFSKGRGYYLTGSSYGNVVLSACTTDRSTLDGVYIDTTGRQPITLSGCALRRDGGNNNGGGGGYAGLRVVGATNPIIVEGLVTETGVDDAGAGAWTPQYGASISGSTSVTVASGVLWGRDGALLDGGGNTNLRVAAGVLRTTGTTGAPTIAHSPDPGAAPTPADNGLIAWTYDPSAAINVSASALATGVLTLARVRLDRPATIGSVLLTVTTGGVGLTAGQSLVGLYNAAGALLGLSADQSAAWATTGNKTVPIVAVSGQSLANLPAGTYFVALLSNGTTPPALARSTSQATVNAGLAAGNYRHATIGSALTAPPAALVLSGMAASSTAAWIGVA